MYWSANSCVGGFWTFNMLTELRRQSRLRRQVVTPHHPSQAALQKVLLRANPVYFPWIVAFFSSQLILYCPIRWNIKSHLLCNELSLMIRCSNCLFLPPSVMSPGNNHQYIPYYPSLIFLFKYDWRNLSRQRNPLVLQIISRFIFHQCRNLSRHW